MTECQRTHSTSTRTRLHEEKRGCVSLIGAPPFFSFGLNRPLDRISKAFEKINPSVQNFEPNRRLTVKVRFNLIRLTTLPWQSYYQKLSNEYVELSGG